MSFTELQFPTHISQGSSFGPAWRTQINMVNSGYEERKLKWTSQRCEGLLIFNNNSIAEFEEILDWFYAMQGSGYGFRFKDFTDYKSCSLSGTPAFDDQTIGTGDGVTAAFQLIKKYTKGLTYQRDIKKPISGTVKAGVGGIESATNFSVNTATGVVTFDDITKTINAAVSSGSLTTLGTSTNHGLVTGDSVYLSGFTGDWAVLNGERYIATASTAGDFTIEYDSSGLTAYSSNGGQLDTAPQPGETVTAGFEFDVPVRFDSDRLDVAYVDFESFSFQLPIVEIKL